MRCYPITEQCDKIQAKQGTSCASFVFTENYQALLELPDPDPESIFGYPDDLKLCSSLTLFDIVSPDDIFADALAECFEGEKDGETVKIVANWERH